MPKPFGHFQPDKFNLRISTQRSANILQSPISQFSMVISPSAFCEVLDATTRYDYPFGLQERALCKQVPSEAAQFAAGRDDTMTGNRSIVARTHDVADGAVCPRAARCSGDIAISRHAAGRNAADDSTHARCETLDH
jgi:hypothetical protein